MSLISVKVIKSAAPDDRARACADKVRYGHQHTAETVIVNLEHKGSQGLEAYACDHCGGWHIGHGMGWLGKTLLRLLGHLAK